MSAIRSPLRGSLALNGTENTETGDYPSFRLLCVMTHHVFDRLGAQAEPSDVIDELKHEIARARLPSPPPHVYGALFDAVRLARAKGYATPRPRRA